MTVKVKEDIEKILLKANQLPLSEVAFLRKELEKIEKKRKRENILKLAGLLSDLSEEEISKFDEVMQDRPKFSLRESTDGK